MSQHTLTLITDGTRRVFYHAIPRAPVTVNVNGSPVGFTVPFPGAVDITAGNPAAGSVITIDCNSVAVDYADYFTPPWNGLSKPQGPAGPTTLLLNRFNGTHGATAPFPSTVGPSATTYGGVATLSNVWSPFGTTSLRLEEEVAVRFQAPEETDEMWFLGTGNFCFEGRFKADNLDGTPTIVECRGLGGDGILWLSSAQLIWYSNQVGYIATSGTLSAGTAYYWMVDRSEGVTSLYVGTSGTAARVAQGADASDYALRRLEFGRGLMFVGNMAEIRLSRGSRANGAASVPIPAAAFTS